MNEVTITVPVETIQLALRGLDELPHKQVRKHIDILIEKTNAAISRMAAAESNNEAAPAEE